MNKHPDCEDRCQILEYKGYHDCSQTGQCELLIASGENRESRDQDGGYKRGMKEAIRVCKQQGLESAIYYIERELGKILIPAVQGESLDRAPQPESTVVVSRTKVNPAAAAAPADDLELPEEPQYIQVLRKLPKGRSPSSTQVIEYIDALHRVVEGLKEQIIQWQKVTAKNTPDEAAKGIEVLHNRWQQAERKLAGAQATIERQGDAIAVWKEKLAEAKSRARKDREDAERYRWLRDNVGSDVWNDLPYITFRGVKFDERIDAARAAEGKEGK